MKLAQLAVVMALVVAACASSSTPRNTPERGSQCATDDDCAVASFHECCQGCPNDPFAESKSVVDQLRRTCDANPCPPGPPRQCPSRVSDKSFRAECRASHCVLAPAPPTPTPSASQSQAITPTPTSCKTNDDCAMSTVRSCCSPCGLPPFADLKSEVDAVTKKCAVVECAMRVPQECKPTESIDVYHAECQNAACVAVRNPPPPVTPTAAATLTSNEACSRDGDCVISNFGSCCSSCGASAYATSKRDLEARNRRCTIVDCAMDGRERCDPTIPASLYRAVCRSGSCAGVKR